MSEYMKKWGDLSLAKKEQLISKYGVTAVGVPPEPLNATEYYKIPESEFPVEKKEKKKKKAKKVEVIKKAPKVAKKAKSKEIKATKKKAKK